MKWVRLLAIWVFASGLIACSPGMPGMGGKDDNSSSDTNSGDSVSIDKPTMVGGGYVTGYLACQFDTKVAEDASSVGFKCRIENAGQKITLPSNSTVNHSVYDLNDNRLQQVVLSPEEEDSASHWSGSVDRSLVSNLRIETVLNYGEGSVLNRSTYVSDPPNSADGGTVQQQGSVNLVGVNHTYIFGALADTLPCSTERKKGGDTAILLESNLQSLTLVFNAPNDTLIDVDLFHLCNLDKSEPLVTLSRADDGKVIKKSSLSKESGLNDQRVLKRFDIKAGRYELQILISKKLDKLWEKAFSLGDIQITSSHAIDSNIEVRPSSVAPVPVPEPSSPGGVGEKIGK